MKTKINCLIFDFDGVIADTDLARFYILRDILKEYGIDLSNRFSMKDLNGLSTEAYLKKNYENLSSSQIEGIVRKKHHLHFTNLEQYVIPFPGIQETLEYFHNRFDLVMVSANPYKNLQILLNHLGIKKYFKWIFGREVCENTDLEKTYSPIASKIQREVSECIVIEDSEYGVKAARKAGYYCLRFDPNNRFDPGLENDKAKTHSELKKKIEKYTTN
ncbi:MAG: HAD hydrolase-like protein [Bacteroidales bacterium]|nr:HAD hydrolase-like protein [Bacteroidales bacterium]